MIDKRKRNIIIFAATGFILLIVVLSILFAQKTTPIQDEYSAMPVTQTTSMVFNNSYELIYAIGTPCTDEALNQIRSATEVDINTPSTATIKEESFLKISLNPEIYSFIVSIDDGRIYQIYVRLDSEQSDAEPLRTTSVSTYVKQKNADSGYIFKTSAIDPALQQILAEWAKQI